MNYRKIKFIVSQLRERIFNNANILILSKHSKILSNVTIKGSKIYGNVFIDKGSKVIDGATLKGGSEIRIGKYTSINGPNTDLVASINKIIIGNFCSIARSVSIQEFNHNFDTLTSYFINSNVFGEKVQRDINSKGNIEIGNDVWIGAQCVILSGAKIGDGAVIAANSVVSGVIEPFAIVAGSPAHIIKYRFDKDIIDRLLEIQWWTWTMDKIFKNQNLFVGKLTHEKLDNII